MWYNCSTEYDQKNPKKWAKCISWCSKERKWIARSYCLLCWKLHSARCIMSLLIQSAEGVVRKDGGRGGEWKTLWLKLKNATKWNKDECSTEPQTEYKRQSCEIYMAGRRDEQHSKLQTLPVAYNTSPDPEPVDHPRTLRDHANSYDLSNGVVFWSPRQQETGRHAA